MTHVTRRPAILGGPGGYASPLPPSLPPTFLRSKKKKGKQREKRKTSKQKLLKACHQGGQNVTVLAILERLGFKNFSGRQTMVADNTCQCSIAPPLWNPNPIHLYLPYYLQLKSGTSFINNMASSGNKYKNKQISYQ